MYMPYWHDIVFGFSGMAEGSQWWRGEVLLRKELFVQCHHGHDSWHANTAAETASRNWSVLIYTKIFKGPQCLFLCISLNWHPEIFESIEVEWILLTLFPFFLQALWGPTEKVIYVMWTSTQKTGQWWRRLWWLACTQICFILTLGQTCPLVIRRRKSIFTLRPHWINPRTRRYVDEVTVFFWNKIMISVGMDTKYKHHWYGNLSNGSIMWPSLKQGQSPFGYLRKTVWAVNLQICFE